VMRSRGGEIRGRPAKHFVRGAEGSFYRVKCDRTDYEQWQWTGGRSC
jgi:hypothetical protein